MREQELEANLEKVFGFTPEQQAQFSLALNHENINRMMLASQMIFPEDQYLTRPELSMSNSAYEKLKPGDAWDVKNPHFQEAIQPQDWPFDKFPYMPVAYGAAVEKGGQGYATFMVEKSEGLYDYVYMTHEQANEMVMQVKDNADTFEMRKYRNALSVCVGNSRNPIPGMSINDSNFEAHLVAGFDKPEVSAPVVKQQEPAPEKPETKSENVQSAPSQQVVPEQKTPEVQVPRITQEFNQTARPDDKRPPNPKQDFTVASEPGIAALEHLKALKAPEGGAPMDNEHTAAYVIALEAVQHIPNMGEERAQLQQLLAEKGYPDLAEVVGQAVKGFSRNPEGYDYSVFSDQLTALDQNYVDPSEVSDVNRAMLYMDLQAMGHGQMNSFDLNLSVLDETQKGLFVERLADALQNPELYIPDLETGEPEPVFDDDANNSRHTYSNMVKNVGLVVGDTTVKLADGQTYVLCQTAGQTPDDIDLNFKTVDQLKADYDTHLNAVPEFDLSTDEGIRAAVEHMSVLTSYGDAIRYIESDIEENGVAYDLSGRAAEDIKQNMPHVYAAMERLAGPADEAALELLEQRHTFKMKP